MAKRRKTKRHSPRCRRSMSGIGSGGMMDLAAVIGGAVAAQFVGKMAGTAVNSKIVNGGKIAVGFALTKMSKNKMMHGIGLGFAASGGVGLLTDLGVLKGIGGVGEVEYYEFQMMSGSDQLRTLAGYGTQREALTDVDDDLDYTGGDASFQGLNVLSGSDDFEPTHLDY